jgi:hypothetical protein
MGQLPKEGWHLPHESLPAGQSFLYWKTKSRPFHIVSNTRRKVDIYHIQFLLLRFLLICWAHGHLQNIEGQSQKQIEKRLGVLHIIGIFQELEVCNCYRKQKGNKKQMPWCLKCSQVMSSITEYDGTHSTHLLKLVENWFHITCKVYIFFFPTYHPHDIFSN